MVRSDGVLWHEMMVYPVVTAFSGVGSIFFCAVEGLRSEYVNSLHFFIDRCSVPF